MKTTHTFRSRKPAHVLVGSIIALFALPVQAAPLVTDGLLGYWSFDTDPGAGVVPETSGVPGGPYDGLWHGTINATNPTYLTDVPPGFGGMSADLRSGRAIKVITDAGANTYFQPRQDAQPGLNPAPAGAGSEISIAYWKKGGHGGMWNAYVGKDGGNSQFRLIHGSNDTNPQTMTFGRQNRANTPDKAPTSVTTANQENWFHYTFTFKAGGQARIYENGILLKSEGAGNAMQTNNSPLGIGANFDAAGNPYEGSHQRMDEVYIFGKELTAAQAMQLTGGHIWDGTTDGIWANGNWAAAGSPGQTPTANRYMFIDLAASNVTLNADFTAFSLALGPNAASALTIDATRTLTSTFLNVGAAGTLHLNGAVAGAPTISIATGGSINVGASGSLSGTGLTTAGNLNVTAGGSVAVSTVTFMPGNVTSGTLNAPGGFATGATGTVTVGANLEGAGGFTPRRFGGLAILTGTNTYSGPTCTNDWQMYVRANDGTSLSPNTNLRINRQAGFQTGVDLVRPGGTGGGQMQLQSLMDEGAGFTAVGGPVKVCFGSSLASPEALTWNSGFFFPDGDGTTSGGGIKGLFLNGAHVGAFNSQGTDPIEFVNPIDLGTIPDATRWGRVISVTTQSGKMSGVLSGQRGLRKRNGGELILAAINTYTGDTLISEGKLTLADDAQLRFVIPATSPNGNNTLTGGGTAQIDGDFCIDTTLTDASGLTTGTWLLENVGSLPGAYGATFRVVDLSSTPWTDAGAEQWTKLVGSKFYTFDETTGTLTLSLPPSGYGTWATTNAGGQTADLDHNNDGIGNGVAYFMNLIGFGTNPVVNPITKKITWPNGGNIPDTDYGTQFVVQTSTDLTNPLAWTDVLITDPNLINTATELSYTLTGTGPIFVRLKVTPN